jgi:hypothetical protein
MPLICDRLDTPKLRIRLIALASGHRMRLFSILVNASPPINAPFCA